MIRHHAGVMSENHKRGWNIANSHNIEIEDNIKGTMQCLKACLCGSYQNGHFLKIGIYFVLLNEANINCIL